ncbi:MAG: UDP-N-acetylglucosamine 1-carboxyvinyltransferase [Chloroflexi bacterium HGW-Chloroflexi-1]|nr:MAG: UDP-N-acetylglucosamine 1-carboxyvinyltransferase [Chloroflexi bacterium HGW-Chloroflexi-1]
MEKFSIEGKHTLTGDVTPAGNKNAALPILAATLLTEGEVTLHNVPRIGDVGTMLQLLDEMGVTIEDEGSTLCLCARDAGVAWLRSELFQLIRGSMLLAGPLLARFGSAVIPLPGGDRIGRRRVDTHLLALEALGARIDFNRYDFTMHTDGLRGADILLDEMSVTATENAAMAAVLARGTTIIRNAASEPHVQDLCHFLNILGAQIEGIGSNMLVIHGVDRLGGGEFTISPDYLEVGSFLGLGAVTRGEIRIHGVVREHLRMINWVFGQRLGVAMRMVGDTLIVADEQELVISEDIGGAVPKIDDAPWPQFPADLMSIALVVATQARGTVLMHEKMFESRLYFVDKLIAMGARIILCDPHRAVIVGPSTLHGQELSSPDIRAGMALLIAALAAQGTSTIANVGQIDRGYQAIDVKLRELGAHIERVKA